MGKRFKKPKSLPPRKPAGMPLVRPGGVIAGFPEFSQKAHDRYPRFVEATNTLVPLVNQVLAKPIGAKLPRVLHHMTATISNSFGSLIALALNGYGHDGVRIARGMFETAVNAAYLSKNPREIEDYLDYYWIRQKRLMDYMQKDDPALFKQLEQRVIDEINTEYAKVVPRFATSQGKVGKSGAQKISVIERSWWVWENSRRRFTGMPRQSTTAISQD